MARIDPATVFRMVSVMLDGLDTLGASGGSLRVVQLGEPEPSNVDAWCRIIGYTLAFDKRQRAGVGSAEEADTGSFQFRIAVFTTQAKTKPGCISTAAALVSATFDEVTTRDAEEATDANKHQLDFQRPTIEVNDDPGEERGNRSALVTVNGKVFRKAGTSSLDFLT